MTGTDRDLSVERIEVNPAGLASAMADSGSTELTQKGKKKKKKTPKKSPAESKVKN